MQSLKGDKKQLEGDSFFNRKPVEFKQGVMWSDLEDIVTNLAAAF